MQDVRNPQPKETQYSYDNNGNITGIEYPDGAVVYHTYNGLNLPATLVDGGLNITYTYDHEGRLAEEDYGNGTVTEYAYSFAGLLKVMEEVDALNNAYREITYSYDDAGNVTNEIRKGTGIPLEDAMLSYVYDAADRLTRTTELYDASTRQTTYAYDSAGNLKTEATAGVTTTYAYDLQNRLTAKNGVAYSYDKEGNLLTDGTNTYSYDAESRMILGTNKQGETSAYSYNALGVRVLNVQGQHNINYDFRNYIGLGSRYLKHDYLDIYKIDRNDWQPTWETGAGHIVQTETATYTKEYIVDYLSLANRDLMVYNEGEFTERHVYDRSFRRVSTTFAYAEETQRGEPGENIASDTAVSHTEKLVYRTNHLTSTLFAVDETGTVALHMMYDEWGNPQVDTEFNINKSGVSNLNNYTGYTYDDVLGIYYAQNRFYDASTKRFIQEDPIKDGMNWYSYVGNNPINMVDPWGLSASEKPNVSEHLLNVGDLIINDTIISHQEVTNRKLYASLRDLCDAYNIPITLLGPHDKLPGYVRYKASLEDMNNATYKYFIFLVCDNNEYDRYLSFYGDRLFSKDSVTKSGDIRYYMADDRDNPGYHKTLVEVQPFVTFMGKLGKNTKAYYYLGDTGGVIERGHVSGIMGFLHFEEGLDATYVIPKSDIIEHLHLFEADMRDAIISELSNGLEDILVSLASEPMKSALYMSIINDGLADPNVLFFEILLRHKNQMSSSGMDLIVTQEMYIRTNNTRFYSLAPSEIGYFVVSSSVTVTKW